MLGIVDALLALLEALSHPLNHPFASLLARHVQFCVQWLQLNFNQINTHYFQLSLLFLFRAQRLHFSGLRHFICPRQSHETSSRASNRSQRERAHARGRMRKVWEGSVPGGLRSLVCARDYACVAYSDCVRALETVGCTSGGCTVSQVRRLQIAGTNFCWVDMRKKALVP